ncbi:unnamed protein product, partial [marine sediment metagenome]
TVLVVILVCVSAGYVRADKLQLQEKLSKEIKIQLDNVTIAEALEKIGKKAGVKFILSDEAAWKLPQGEATRLSVALDGPLADSMTEMMNAFCMRHAVGDEEITIYPRPELEHILGRPTTEQLELLKVIYTRPIEVYFVDEVQKNINSFFNQDYENYLLWFVVADESDPAFNELCKLKDQLGGNSKARDVQVLVAGQGQSGFCSQKIHNLLYCYQRIGDDVEVLAFADSDVCVRSDWLSHIVYP